MPPLHAMHSVARVAAIARWRGPGRAAPFLCFASQRPGVERVERLGDRRLRPAAPADLVRRNVRRQRSEGTEALLRMCAARWRARRHAQHCARGYRRTAAPPAEEEPLDLRACRCAAAIAPTPPPSRYVCVFAFAKHSVWLSRRFGRNCTVNSPSFCGARRCSTCGAAAARERCWQRRHRHVQSTRY